MKTSEGYISGKATLLVAGEFNRGDVTSSRAVGQTFTPTEAQADAINAGWQRVIDRNPSAFPGPLVAIPHYEVTDGKLELSWATSDFREWAGAGYMNDLVARGYDGTPNAVSTNTVFLTSDDKMVIGKKTEGDAMGSLVTFGGMGHPERDLDENGNYDPFKNAERKALDELGLNPKFTLKGLAYQAIDLRDSHEQTTPPANDDLGRCGPVALFVARTALTAAEVADRHAQAPDTDGELIIVDQNRTPESIAKEYKAVWTAESALNVRVAQEKNTNRRLLVPPQRVRQAMAA